MSGGLRHRLGRAAALVAEKEGARPERGLVLLGPDDPEPSEPGVVGVRVSFELEPCQVDEDGKLILSRLTDAQLRELITVTTPPERREHEERAERLERCYHGEADCDCRDRAEAALAEVESWLTKPVAVTTSNVAQQLHRDPSFDVAAYVERKAAERAGQPQPPNTSGALGRPGRAAEQVGGEPILTPPAPPPVRRTEPKPKSPRRPAVPVTQTARWYDRAENGGPRSLLDWTP